MIEGDGVGELLSALGEGAPRELDVSDVAGRVGAVFIPGPSADADAALAWEEAGIGGGFG